MVSRDDDFAVEYAGVEFGERKNDAIIVGGFEDDIRNHGWSAHLLAVGDAGSFQKIFERDTFVDFFFLRVGIGDGEGLARHFFEIGGGENKRGLYSRRQYEARLPLARGTGVCERDGEALVKRNAKSVITICRIEG